VQGSSAEIERLTAELTAVLKRAPRSGNPLRGKQSPRDRQTSAIPEASDTTSATDEPQFSWRALQEEPRRQPSGSEGPADVESGVVHSSMLDWLKKARRERRWRMAQRAGAWAVTVAVGGTLVAVAAYVIMGDLPNLSGVVSSTFSRLN
jgi:hypothetical protein